MKTNLLSKKSLVALMIVGVSFAYSCNSGTPAADSAKTDSTKVAPTPEKPAATTVTPADTTKPAATDTTKK